MPSAPNETMQVGQHGRLKTVPTLQDGTTPDPSRAISVSVSTTTGAATASVDPASPQDVLVTATAPGTAIVIVDEVPPTNSKQLQMIVTVQAPPPDNRTVLFGSWAIE